MSQVKIGIFIPRALHRRLRLALIKHDTSGQAALLAAVEQLVEELERTEPEAA